MNLLQQESSLDLDLKADWNRNSHGTFPLQEGGVILSSKTAPLPPIHDWKPKEDTSPHCDITIPNWKHVSEDVRNFYDDDTEDVVDNNDKWLRSSTPANTLPSIYRK